MHIVATSVYVLCLLTSSACGLLLVRGYLRSHTRLLLWCAACFVLLALNNLLVVIDLIVLPSIDLTTVRNVVLLLASCIILIGFIFEIY